MDDPFQPPSSPSGQDTKTSGVRSYPPLTPDIEKGLSLGSLKYFGAGAIMASVTIGSGETFFASKGGAIFGYALLWCFVVSAILKGVQVYASARYFTLTGEHPMSRFGELPGPKNWVPWLFAILSIACFPFWLSGLPLMIGTAVNWMLGMPFEAANFDQQAKIWGTVILLVSAGLALLQTYKILETAQTILVALLLLGMTFAAFAASPDMGAMASGMVPTIPGEWPAWFSGNASYKDDWELPVMVFIGTCLGAVGGGVYDYIGYVGCFREKAWGLIGVGDPKAGIDTSAENVHRGKRWLLPTKIDVGVGFLCVLFFTFIFVSLGAEILFPKETAPDKRGMLNLQAQFLTDIHPALSYVYKIGIFMAFFGTIYGAFEIYSRTARECLLPISARVRRMKPRWFHTLIVLYCGLVPLPLLWGVDNAQSLVAPAAIIGGVFACGLWCFAMLWADRRVLPKPLQSGPVLTGLLLVAGFVLTGLGVWSIIAFDWVGFGQTLIGQK